jgi:hypothetical protein
MRSSKTLFLGLTFGLLALQSVGATDVTIPEEELFALFASRVQEARSGFRKLVEQRMAEIHMFLREPPDSEVRSVMAAEMISGFSETVVIWENAETWLQQRGGVTPREVYSEVGDSLERANQLMERVEAERKGRTWDKKENEVAYENARKFLRKSVTRTFAFLQNGAARPAQPQSDELLARLEAQIPKDPATALTPEIVQLLEEVGATKRLDAAMLLIRSLAFAWNPIGWSESKSAFDCVPAAGALQRNFGSQALPLLMAAGVTTDESWRQIRIAVAMRGIGSAAEIERLTKAFALAENRDPAAVRFAARLSERELSFADDPVLSAFDQLKAMIEELLKKQPQP